MEEFNSDELEAPQWMDATFLVKVLSGAIDQNPQNIHIDNYVMKPGARRGDHYASVMFRAVIEYRLADSAQLQKKSLIIKVMPQVDGEKMDMLQDSWVFETEIGMYNEIMPKFHELLRSISDSTVLSTRCIYHSLSPQKIIAFNDLVEQGYDVLRTRCTTEHELQKILEKRAKWDACSMKLLSENPDIFTKYRHGLMNMPHIQDIPHMNQGIAIFLQMIESQPTLKLYKPYMLALEKLLFKECRKSFDEYHDQPNPNTFYTLNHGDFHIRNMMFKWDEVTGEYKDVLFLDFQACYVGPLVNDLIYLRHTVLNEGRRINRFDETLKFYLDILRETLTKLNYNGKFPEMADLKAELKRQRFFDIFLAVTFLPLMDAFQSNTFDMEKYVTTDEYRHGFFYRESYVKHIEQLFSHFKAQGYFEDLL